MTSTHSASGSLATAAPQLLPLDRVSKDQHRFCLQWAADQLVATVTGRPLSLPQESPGQVHQAMIAGAFVTLKRGGVLRGCCGAFGQPMTVTAAIAAAAAKTAREDQRLAPISPCEMPYLSLEVTLLGPLSRIKAAGQQRAESVRIGKHGLLIQRGSSSGLLLPSVAVDRGWSAAEFLRAVCAKAQLATDAWEKDDVSVWIFDGQSISGRLVDCLPEELPLQAPLPLTTEQVADYARLAGQNISAMASGGTPSYVAPHLPDVTVHAIVLSVQWDESAEPSAQLAGQASAIKLSYRPGVPLQSTLFQMCQQTANLLIQRRFSGKLAIGLTLGFDPALHGSGPQAELAGVATSQRAVILSDARTCGFAYDPRQTADQLRDQLRQLLPVGSRDVAVHTVQALSTMPQVVCVSSAGATVSRGVRAPAVAGKFYPAEDAARRALVASLCTGQAPAKVPALAAMVPHAGLKYSGKIAAVVWRSLELPPRTTLLIISPKHTSRGVNWAVCPQSAWALSATTTIDADVELAQRIAESVTGFELDSAAHAEEHGIEVQLPLIERVAPDARVVGLAMQGGSWSEIQQAAAQLASCIASLDRRPQLIISSDLNHYADDAENRRRDRWALDALAAGDPQALLDVCRRHEVSMCGVIPAALVLETLRQLGLSWQPRELGYGTSADVTGDRSRVVGYGGMLWV